MLTVGLALLLLSGELARFFKFSPLLVGIAIGFTIVNRDHRDVRLFRTLNAFEPPIYVLFFTLAGAQLDFSALKVAGWLGFVYFLLRFATKALGAYWGGYWAGASTDVRKYLGFALIPQAGVAIGLIFLIDGDPNLHVYASILTPTVLVGVLFAELIGPACTKYALGKSGEAIESADLKPKPDQFKRGEIILEEAREAQLVPWSWGQLKPADSSSGVVVFGVSHENTVNGLARMATLLAHHFKGRPVAVSIETENDDISRRFDPKELFSAAAQEVKSLGYSLHMSELRAESVAQGIIAACRERKTLAVLLGYPFHRTESSFNKIVEEVAQSVACPIIIVRFTGILHTERILVPIIQAADLVAVGDTLCALAHVGKHSITLLRLLSTEMQELAINDYEKKLHNWAASKNLPFANCRAVKTEARLETIIKEAQTHDLLIMSVTEGSGIKKMLLGSLADDVASNCQRPMLMVHHPKGVD